jgi:hypothetical protein
MATGKKRLNPKTGKLFKRGDVREDGYIFRQYMTSRVSKDGFFYLDWVHPDKVGSEKRLDKKRREEFFKEVNWKKRINPQTKKIFKVGDRNKKGQYFLGYKQIVKSNGYLGEDWFGPEAWHKHRIKAIYNACRIRAKKNNLSFNLSPAYLTSLYPKNNKCPILGIELKWGDRTGGRTTSPSLDRINPNKGYEKGNVMWMSSKANTMKSNATPVELKKFATWIKKNVK